MKFQNIRLYLLGFVMVYTNLSISSETTKKNVDQNKPSFNKNQNPLKDDRPTKALSLNFASIAKSNADFRGAEFWSHSSFILGVGAELYNFIKIQGPNISSQHFFFDRFLKLENKISYFDDNPPLITKNRRQKTYKNKRKNSLHYTLSNELKWMLNRYQSIKLGFNVNQDFIAYKKSYMSMYLALSLPWKMTLQTLVDYGGQLANQYAYGRGGISGLGHFNISLSKMFFPKIIPGLFILKVSSSNILKDENRDADFVRGDSSVQSGQILYIWNFY